jgi:signal transduction histidine kinase/ligand-binding sensor domain-containing protein
LAEDREGTIWLGTSGGLARFDGNRWMKVGAQWSFPGTSAHGLFLDRAGTLWVATEKSIVFLPRGAKTFQSTSTPVGLVPQIAQAPNGKLWMAETTRSVRPIPLGTKFLPSDETEIRVGSQGICFDRDNSLWIASIGDGLFRVSVPGKLKGKPDRFNGVLEAYTMKDGLSDEIATTIFQDRDGNLWIGTVSGLDRFRKALVPVYSPVDRHDADLVEGNEGDIWITRREGLARVHNSRINPVAFTADVTIAGYRDPAGIIWWVSVNALVRYHEGRFTQFRLPEELPLPFQRPVNITEDRSGTLWMAADGEGLFCRKNGQWSRFQTPARISRLAPRTAFTDDRGWVWFGYEDGTIIHLKEGEMGTVSIPLEAEVGSVEVIRGRNGQVWAGGTLGLASFDGRGFRNVIPADVAAFGEVSGLEEAADGSLWLRGSRGVIHIDQAEILKFQESPTYRVQYGLLDSSDGLPGAFRRIGQKEVSGSNGLIWFWSTGGLAWLNPASIAKNVPPPVSIRSVVTDRSRFVSLANLILPPRTSSLRIEYGAVNLSNPKRVRYRYELDGADKGWQDAGVRREAFYTNLGPGKHRFRVSARNEGGQWNTVEAVLEFNIAPEWFQTIWFRTFCVCFIFVLLWLTYQLRLRQLEHRFDLALEARISERTRIARELHDTLLQSFQGLTLHFQRARNLLPDRAAEAIQTLDRALDGAEEAIVEGRDAIHDLRSPTTAAKALAEEITALGEELIAKGVNTKESVEFRILIEGSVCPMLPNLHIEVFRIAREALRNAFSHSQGKLIETELAYIESMFRLRIRDDGKGIDPEAQILAERTGHWGLKGMRERAEHLGGELEVWSELGAGTEIELRLPASIAYERAVSPSSSWKIWGRKSNS